MVKGHALYASSQCCKGKEDADRQPPPPGAASLGVTFLLSLFCFPFAVQSLQGAAFCVMSNLLVILTVERTMLHLLRLDWYQRCPCTS